jgi:ethanolamine transporter EutH
MLVIFFILGDNFNFLAILSFFKFMQILHEIVSSFLFGFHLRRFLPFDLLFFRLIAFGLHFIDEVALRTFFVLVQFLFDLFDIGLFSSWVDGIPFLQNDFIDLFHGSGGVFC